MYQIRNSPPNLNWDGQKTLFSLLSETTVIQAATGSIGAMHRGALTEKVFGTIADNIGAYMRRKLPALYEIGVTSYGTRCTCTFTSIDGYAWEAVPSESF